MREEESTEKQGHVGEERGKVGTHDVYKIGSQCLVLILCA